MKRTKVVSPRGVAILQRQDHLTDAELQARAAQLGERNVLVMYLKGHDKTSASITHSDADAPAASVDERWFLFGRDVADQYSLDFEGIARAAGEDHVVFSIAFVKVKVPVGGENGMKRHLTETLRQTKRI